MASRNGNVQRSAAGLIYHCPAHADGPTPILAMLHKSTATLSHFYRTTHMHSTVYAMAGCLSVRHKLVFY